VTGITAGSVDLPRFYGEAAELEEALKVVTKVVVVDEGVGHNVACADDETWPSEPGPLCPLFDLVAVRHDCGGLLAVENPDERTRFRVVARCAEVAEAGTRDTALRLRGERFLAQAG
jgi:hypothetical protein